jgi:agmatine deiminase
VAKGSIRFPAEWEQQDAILLAWPTANSDWGATLEDIEAVFIELATTISRFERVIIVGNNKQHIHDLLANSQANLDNIGYHIIATNDTWARDFGPLGVYQDGTPLLYDCGFNGWGLKFPADKDNQINRQLYSQNAFSCPLLTQGIILEGGSIESDGAGTLLTTSQCLLSPNRNPQLTREQIEDFFTTHFGIKQLLWLDHGYLAGDDTDSHIDTLARLCPNDTILYTACGNTTDEHFVALQQMEQQLSTFKTPAGHRYTLSALPWPQAQFDTEGQRLPATYANFLIINDAVLVPTYADPADNKALAIIQRAFPEREVIGINCNPVIVQHGSLHCLTMQLPQGTLS